MIATRWNEHSTQQTQCMKQPIAMATVQRSKNVQRSRDWIEQELTWPC